MEIRYGKRMMVSSHVGCTSLIGVGDERPTHWGNYCWLDNGMRVLNFWAENLDTAREEFLDGGLVEGIVYETKGFLEEPTKSWVIIDDKRIPENWYHNKLCFTGGTVPPVYMLKEIYDYLGDPNFEFEQFLDPIAYHEKRNGQWMPGGIVKYSINAQARQLKCNYTLENATDLKATMLMDSAVFYAPNIAPVKSVDTTLRVFGQKSLKENE